SGGALGSRDHHARRQEELEGRLRLILTTPKSLLSLTATAFSVAVDAFVVPSLALRGRFRAVLSRHRTGDHVRDQGGPRRPHEAMRLRIGDDRSPHQRSGHRRRERP
ncbi:hypothetical protein ACHAWF_000892, partial [Thalassiosira exigua]